MHLWYRSTSYFDTPDKTFGCLRSHVYTAGLFVLVIRRNFTVLQVIVRYDLWTPIADVPDCLPVCWPYTAVFSLTKSSTLGSCSSMGDDWPDGLSSLTHVLHASKRSSRSNAFRWFMERTSYCANIQRCISAIMITSAYRNRTTAFCSWIVQTLKTSGFFTPCYATERWKSIRCSVNQRSHLIVYCLISKLSLITDLNTCIN